MKVIMLNHSLQPFNNKLIVTIALLLSVLLVVFCAYFLLSINAELAGLEQQRNSYSYPSSVAAVSRPLTERERSELEAVKAAMRNILIPWPKLFKALEAAKLDQVNVLRVDPNVKAKTVVISALTLDSSQMLVYINKLKQQAIFNAVSLNSTEVVNLRGQQAIQFELSVSWQDSEAGK